MRKCRTKVIVTVAFMGLGLLYFTDNATERLPHDAICIQNHEKYKNGESSFSLQAERRKCSNAERLLNIRDKCKSDPPGLSPDPDDPLTYQRLLLDEVHKIIFCVIPKSGSTSIKTLLRDVSHNPEAGKAHVWKHSTLAKYADLKFMSSLPVKTTKAKLSSHEYTKFLLVRHPIARLLSAFKNRIVDTVYKHSVYKEILTVVRPGKDISRHDRPTWEEFVRYLPSNRDHDDDVSNDKHWGRQVDMCHPCLINYDYVMRLETLSDDIIPLIDILKKDEFLKDNNRTIKVPEMNPSKGKTSQLFYSLTSEDQEKMKMRYIDDLNIFGYNISSPSSTFSCSIKSQLGSCC